MSVLSAICLAWVSFLVVALLFGIMLERHSETQALVVDPYPVCPMCHTGDPLVDDDDVALCLCCRCSYEVVTL